MLKIINNLTPFFEDCYRRINVREYAKIIKVTPPTASSILRELEKEGLLQSREFLNSRLYRAKRESPLFMDISRPYFRQKLESLASYLAESTNYALIILFGSLSKGEAKISSDIDIFINANPKDIPVEKFEKELQRKIELHFNSSLKNKALMENIKKGVVLYGDMNGLEKLQ